MSHPLLVLAAALNGVAALLHVGCIVFGASWYRFFGAGPRMAKLAAAGSWRPTAITAGIILALAACSLYALSGAGVIPRLPALRLTLCVITCAYLLRGVGGFALAIVPPGYNGTAFWRWSSAICLAIGAVHLAGTWHAWPQLAGVTS